MGWWRTKRAEEIALIAKAVDAFTTAMSAQSALMTKQMSLLEAHLELFKPPEQSSGGWVNRDEDEYRAELVRRGFPADGTQKEQLEWLSKNVDSDLPELYELRAVAD